jgi:hypothetical protein
VRDDERFDGKHVVLSDELGVDAGELVRDTGRCGGRSTRFVRSVKSVSPREAVDHRAHRRIVCQAYLCVAAYLLMRIAKNPVGEIWPLVRERLERVTLGPVETDYAAIFRVRRQENSEGQV